MVTVRSWCWRLDLRWVSSSDAWWSSIKFGWVLRGPRIHENVACLSFFVICAKSTVIYDQRGGMHLKVPSSLLTWLIRYAAVDCDWPGWEVYELSAFSRAHVRRIMLPRLSISSALGFDLPRFFQFSVTLIHHLVNLPGCWQDTCRLAHCIRSCRISVAVVCRSMVWPIVL